MIRGIGIDSVKVARFNNWYTYSEKTLLRIFSAKEIEYCLQYEQLSAQRFAARFAAKEAFLKAISSMYPDHQFFLLKICKHVSINKNWNKSPQLVVDWLQLSQKTPYLKAQTSLTHTAITAIAIVILES